jgi:DNA topoisomerase-1
MGDKSLVIVESPTKAKTITKFLGKDYIVKASMGHIRDLPDSAAEIPAELKKQPWARLGVNIEGDFSPLYVIPKQKKENVKALRDAMKQAAVIYLATDEDREGESISWHLLEALKPKIPTKRLVFHEITKDAIQDALQHPRDIDENLVRAQETRRIVDRLYGYEVSPLLWKKMARGLSAGRVQSVAIRLLVEREHERVRFRKATYWSLKALFQKGESAPFEAELTHVGNARIAVGKDFDPNTGKLKAKDAVVALTEAEATALLEQVRSAKHLVSNVEEKPYSSSPPAPFVTSTLQQEANAKLRFSAKHTMSVAQQLYENGYITYMRTDSTTLSEQALQAARSLIAREYGAEYLPKAARIYATKVKNAQEAHEAIRPAGESFTPLDVVKSQLGPDAYRLYELIWKRTVASQMENARGTNISVQIASGPARFRASGKTIEFPGFLRAYVEGSDDPNAELADREKVLPKLLQGDELLGQLLETLERSTQPPARYTEGSLIKELERLGIGRPSTWATIVELVLSRSYAFKKGTALVPTFTAVAVVGLMERHFANILDYEFTARLEDDLDAISRGEALNIDYLRSFYYGNGFPGLKALVQKGENEIDPRVVCGIPIGTTAAGENIEVRIGRFGPFITNGTVRSSVPDMMTFEELTVETAEQILRNAAKEPESLGIHPETGENIYIKNGRFGPYIQLGEMQDDAEKPKRASLLPGMTPEDITLDTAVALLSLPRTLGVSPENGSEVIAANGRYGPYIKCGIETRSIPMEQTSPLTITLEAALELLRQPKSRGRSSSTPKVIRELGEHPDSKLPLVVRTGRYGPYVTDGTLNATLPRGLAPENVSMEEAVALLQARAERGPVKKTRGRKAAAPAKKTGEKKSAAKRTKKAAAGDSEETTPAKPKAAKKPAAKKSKTSKAHSEPEGAA